MKWKPRNLRELGKMVCGDAEHFAYRSSSYITEFFEDCDLDFRHDGSTRYVWCAERIADALDMPHLGSHSLPDAFVRIIRRLMDRGDAQTDDADRSRALEALNKVLEREGWCAVYDEHGTAQLRHIATNTFSNVINPHRPMSQVELERRGYLEAYLSGCSEDELIENILLPLFKQLGFHRITNAGHTDKALEYGKDVWMKFTLPTLHILYFGIQAKKGKIDAAGVSTGNIAEIYNQVTMMLGHEVFDPETNRRVLVDHAFIVSGGDITKAARNWIGGKLDANRRSQVMFMDKEDILNLYIVTNLPLPGQALPGSKALPDAIPF